MKGHTRLAIQGMGRSFGSGQSGASKHRSVLLPADDTCGRRRQGSVTGCTRAMGALAGLPERLRQGSVLHHAAGVSRLHGILLTRPDIVAATGSGSRLSQDASGRECQDASEETCQPGDAAMRMSHENHSTVFRIWNRNLVIHCTTHRSKKKVKFFWATWPNQFRRTYDEKELTGNSLPFFRLL
jgi:hypothetical protein